ncbi:MAG: alpha/beta hydrolase, partial [Nevskiaceae bacterium]
MRAAAGLALALLAAGCTQLFLHPGKMQVLHPQKLGLAYEDVWLEAPDGAKLHGWYLHPEALPRGTVLHLHGNAENISTFIAAVHWLPAHGYGVLLVDYRGYGRSEGVAIIDTVHEDARLALDHALARPGPLFVFGQSLGGSAAVHAVARHPQRTRVAAVITEGAYASYRRIARQKMNQVWFTWPLQWPLSFLFSDRYAAEKSAAVLAPVPLLVVHGE